MCTGKPALSWLLASCGAVEKFLFFLRTFPFGWNVSAVIYSELGLAAASELITVSHPDSLFIYFATHSLSIKIRKKLKKNLKK